MADYLAITNQMYQQLLGLAGYFSSTLALCSLR